MSDLRTRIKKILDDQACIEGWDGERVCDHPDHGNMQWREGEVQCNGASELLLLLREALIPEPVMATACSHHVKEFGACTVPGCPFYDWNRTGPRHQSRSES